MTVRMLGRKTSQPPSPKSGQSEEGAWWERPEAGQVLMKFPGVLTDTEFRLHLEEDSRRGIRRRNSNASAVAGGEILLSPESLRLNLAEKEQPSLTELSHIVFVSFTNIDLALMPSREEEEKDKGGRRRQSKNKGFSRVSMEDIGNVIISGSVGRSSNKGPDEAEESGGLRRNLALSEPVTVRLNKNALRSRESIFDTICLAWDDAANSWSDEICKVVASDKNVTKCLCSRLTRYTLGSSSSAASGRTTDDMGSSSGNLGLSTIRGQGGDGKKDFKPDDLLGEFTKTTTRNRVMEYGSLSFILIVVVASSILVITVLALVLVVIYCRRIKVGKTN